MRDTRSFNAVRPTTAIMAAMAGMAVAALMACDRREREPTDEAGRPELPKWTAVEELRIGSEEVPDHALTLVGALLLTDDGELWVVQSRDRNVRVFGPDGRLIRRVGGPGQGPGEFIVPSGIGWWRGTTDTVWISDAVSRRMNLFTVGGTFVRAFTIPPVAYRDSFTVALPRMILQDGNAVALASYGPGTNEWADFPLLRYDPADGVVHSEVVRLAKSPSILIRWEGRGISTGVHPFPDSPIVAHPPAADRILVVDRPAATAISSASIKMTMLAPNGETLWSRSYPYTPDSLPRAEADSVMEARIAAFQRFTRLERVLSDAEAEQAYRNSVPVPQFRPPVRSALIGTDDRIWLEWSSAPGAVRRWWVLDPRGTPMASVDFPGDVDIRATGDGYIWAVEINEDDVQYLVRYRLRGSGH